MAINNTPPDDLYLRSREDLLPYEDARMNSLLQGMANYYTTRNDQSTWGNFLRALAKELARLDYSYSYDIVNKNPAYLTPPDIRRRWNDPLYVSSNWPSKTQFDTDFKAMLIELIAAYREGSTAQGIQDVIFAYTGINIQVQELYKQIGNGVYDQSDRNAIKVSVAVGNNSLSEITSLTQLQQIISSLYGAIDLAKPAHVGLEFTTIFGEGDDIDCFISPAYLTQQQYIQLSSAQQGIYTQDSYVLINPPVFWIPSTADSMPFTLYTLLRDRNGNLQLVISAGKPGTTEPTWNQTSGGTTLDGQITWLNISPAVTNLALTSNVVTVTAINTFTMGQQVKLADLNTGEGFSFLNGVQLSVLTSDGVSFTAAYTHVDVASTPQTQGTVTYLPASKIDILTYQALPALFKNLYQERYTNTKCDSTGIDDTLRIFIRQVEEPPQDPMLIQAPVLDPSNPKTTIAAYGLKMSPTLTLAQWAALPTIAFNIVNTVADGVNAGYTFSGLTAYDLHEGMRVTITGCRSAFNITGRIQDVVMLSPTSGTFQIPLNQTIASQSETGSGVVSPLLQQAYTLKAGQYVLLDDSSQAPLNDSSLNPPSKWIQVIDKTTNLPTGEVANWDKAHPAGLVAPRLDQVWEISGGDQDFVFGMS